MNERPFTIRWRIAFFLIALVQVLNAGCQRPAESSASAVQARPASFEVVLVVDFNGRSENLTETVAGVEGDTVFDMIDRTLTVVSRGNGKNVFVQSLNGVENEGAGGDNWVYFVDDQLADRGCGDWRLTAGQQVRWRFGAYNPESDPDASPAK